MKKKIGAIIGLVLCVLAFGATVEAREDKGFSYDNMNNRIGKAMIDDILQADRELRIPETIGSANNFVASIQLDAGSQFVTVKTLVLPSQLQTLKECWKSKKKHGTCQILELFPNLKEVQVAESNIYLCTDGDAIYSKDKTILYSVRCGVEEYEIPASVQVIKPAAFAGAKKLAKITVQTGNGMYKTKDGVLFSMDEKKLILMPPCLPVQQYQVPEGVESIEERAFERQRGLRSVQIPGTVDVIGTAAFEKCSHLQSVKIADGVRKIGGFAFYGSWELADITLGEGIQSLGEAAFEGTVIRNLVLPSTLEKVAYRHAREPELPLEQLDTLVIKSPYLNVRNFYYIGQLAEYPVVYAVKNSDAYRLFRKVTKVYALSGTKAVTRPAKKDKKQRKKEEKSADWYCKTKDKVYKIRTAEQLMSLSFIGRYIGFYGETFILEKDIDMKGRRFEPIVEFDAVFDGNGKKIKNLRIDKPGEDRVGLFSLLDGRGKVKNLTVEGTVNGRSKVGLICGECEYKSRIVNCRSRGSVSGMSQVGGIVGTVSEKSLIEKNKSQAKVRANYFAGGILGFDASAKKKNLGRNHISGSQDVRAFYRYAGLICSNLDKR